MATNSTNSLIQARRIVEQLRIDANLRRIKVSKAAMDLMDYCNEHIREDPLLNPPPSAENPFREKRVFCNIL
uniref:guanine nucleotide-binding protein G(I)/G(S)/G(O) subunit gamma-2-like n=1 Tax=Myxine glutinosa TaxID=7769 RepID=UPI00358E3657